MKILFWLLILLTVFDWAASYYWFACVNGVTVNYISEANPWARWFMDNLGLHFTFLVFLPIFYVVSYSFLYWLILKLKRRSAIILLTFFDFIRFSVLLLWLGCYLLL